MDGKIIIKWAQSMQYFNESVGMENINDYLYFSSAFFYLVIFKFMKMKSMAVFEIFYHIDQ